MKACENCRLKEAKTCARCMEAAGLIMRMRNELEVHCAMRCAMSGTDTKELMDAANRWLEGKE